MKDKIVCLVGESGSGKSSIAELLEKEGFNYIQSYTTRPKRSEGETGHIFVTIDTYKYYYGDLDEDFCKDNLQNMISYTFFHGHHYWATREQYKGKGTSIYVVDTKGVEMLRKSVKDAEIIVIYMKCDVGTRLNRLIQRNENSSDQVLEDVWGRIQHDKEKFKMVQCDYAVDANNDLGEVLKSIKQIIAN